jgi:hypothetical protein
MATVLFETVYFPIASSRQERDGNVAFRPIALGDFEGHAVGMCSMTIQG